MNQLWVMVAGPYGSGALDAAARAAKLRALPVFGAVDELPVAG